MAARELRPAGAAGAASSSSAEAQPLEPFVLAPTEGQFTGDKKLRDRVTGVAIATAIYFIASALIQVLCGLLNERILERNLRSLAQVQAVPELTWLVDALPSAVILSAVPVLVVSFLTGCLFATCGLMGSKANSECCACCYCCCNACYCFCLVLAFMTTLAFLQSVSGASGTAELWFAQCDPKICYPLGFDTNRKTTIDCLAPAVWDDYTVQFEGVDHLPEECPPMYLECGEQDVVEERSLQEIDEEPEEAEAEEAEAEEAEEAGGAAEEVPEDAGSEDEDPGAPVDAPEASQDAETEEVAEAASPEDDADPGSGEPEAVEDAEPVPEGNQDADTEEDEVAEASPEDSVDPGESEVETVDAPEPAPVEDAETEEAEDSGPEDEVDPSDAQGPADEADADPADPEPSGEAEVEDPEADEEEPEEWHGRSENSLKALAQTVLAVPMPEDPLTECQPSKIVALYKVVRREAPSVFDAVWKQSMLRLVAMIPGFLLLSLGFWWGHDLWTKLTKGTGTTPAYVLNLPFGQAESADVQMTHMSQPLMNQP